MTGDLKLRPRRAVTALRTPAPLPEWVHGTMPDPPDRTLFGVGAHVVSTPGESPDDAAAAAVKAAHAALATRLRERLTRGVLSYMRQILTDDDEAGTFAARLTAEAVDRMVTRALQSARVVGQAIGPDPVTAKVTRYALVDVAVAPLAEWSHEAIDTTVRKVQQNASHSFDDVDRLLGLDPFVSRSGERYRQLDEAAAQDAGLDMLSTFAIDVDTVSYTLMRGDVLQGRRPPPVSVRVEEYVNYFNYGYQRPHDGAPFSVTVEAAPSPFRAGQLLMRVGLQGAVPPLDRPREQANVVLLIDTSGSMEGHDRLPLVQQMLRHLVCELQPDDRLAIVTYSDDVRIALPPTSASDRGRALEAVGELRAAGGTAGGPALLCACEVARQMREHRRSAQTRIVLCSDGDFNIGMAGEELIATVESQRDAGIYLSVLLFGRDNINDADMEQLADRGNGVCAAIDDRTEARRMALRLAGTGMQIIAQDVKVQVEFNPAVVHTWRLVGYENRAMPDAAFDDDARDAGELPAGHSCTAWYELVLRDEMTDAAPVPLLPLCAVWLRAKPPGAAASDTPRTWRAGVPVDIVRSRVEAASRSFAFGAAVMQFAQLLRSGSFAPESDMPRIVELATGNHNGSAEQVEFARLVERAQMAVPRDLTR
ncbi:MAG: von Willebrand factor type A domain-containing protein [Planctomycetota bacterium]